MAPIAVLPKRGRVEGGLAVPRQAALLLIALASCGLLVAAATAQPVVAGCTIGPGASCPSADLSGADLRGADLSGANLEGADLRRADLRGADLSGAASSKGRRWPPPGCEGPSLKPRDFPE
jgi:hypothetical protein